MPRPKKPRDQVYRSPQLVIRLPASLKRRIEVVADKSGKTITGWLLPILQREVEKAEESRK